MQSKHIQNEEFTAVVSPITGRTILRNDNKEKFLLSPDFSAIKAGEIAVKIIQYWLSLDGDIRFRGDLADRFHSLSACVNTGQFVSAFDSLIDKIAEWDGARNNKAVGASHHGGWKNRLADYASALWAEGLIAAPVDWPFPKRTALDLCDFALGDSAVWLREIAQASKSVDEGMRRRALSTAFRLAFTGLGVKEIGDIVPGSVNHAVLNWEHRTAAITIKPIIAVQQRIYGKKTLLTDLDWGLGRSKPRLARDFSWVTDEDPSLVDWQMLIRDWLALAKTGLSQKRDSIMILLRFLIANPGIARSPIEYVSRAYIPTVRFEEWIETLKFEPITANKRINGVAGFFDWYVDLKLALEDDLGRPVRNPLLYNPVTRRQEGSKRAETHREAIPVRYLRELAHIISHNDFEWPRSLQDDYLRVFSEEKQDWIRIWSPIRAYALLIKLYLPLRTFQVQMLDSGESDNEDFIDGVWQANGSKLAAKGKTQIRNGFLRKFTDHGVGSTFTGFYVNTNKTSDRFEAKGYKGYEIPWQHEEVIKLTVALKQWQSQYNPVTTPTKWVDLREIEAMHRLTKAQMMARGENVFLFRDPQASLRDQPIRQGRLQGYWKRLMDELEKRVAARGETLPDGSPIQFIEKRDKRGCPTSAKFDLHSLRVSILTALSVEGGVPLSILSKCVAGHATTLMTIYYLKQGPAYISQQMAEAQQRIFEKEQENYLRFLQNAEIASAKSVIAFNDQVSIEILEKKNTVSWSIGDLGICPAGGSMCQQGGEKLSTDESRNDFLPTPGGAKNCVRCRFFVTGPAFLGGLVAHFNDIGASLIQASERLKTFGQEIQATEDTLFAKEGASNQKDLRKLDMLHEHRERALEELDGFALNWHATYILIERCKAILSRDGKSDLSDQSFALVAGGGVSDLTTALANCTDFELYNAICQNATVYPAKTLPTANLRRGRILDAMLARNDRRPVFAVLSDNEAIGVGNELVNFLLARLGRSAAMDVLEGRRLLDSTGIIEDVEKLLMEYTGESIRIGSVLNPDTDQARMKSLLKEKAEIL